MSKLLSAAIVTTFLAAPAFASGVQCDSPAQDQWMSQADLTAMYTEKGYAVKNFKVEDGCYEIYALDANGARIELLVDPVTGTLVGTENEG